MRLCSATGLRGVMQLSCALAAALWMSPAWAAPTIVKRTLANGLTVLVKPEPGSGRLAAALMVKAGSDDDPADAPGANALLSRLLTQNSAHRAPSRLDATGMEGFLSALPEPQVTTYTAVTVPGQMPRALTLLNLVLEPPPWDSEAVVRALRRQEDAEREDAPSDWQRDFATLQAALGLRGESPLPDRPLAVSALRDLHKRLYTANRMTLAVVGDVQPSDVFASAQTVFRKMAPRFEKERDVRAASARPGPPSLNYAFVGWRAAALTDADAACVEVIAAALGGGKTSALFRTLRERDGTGYESGITYPRRLGPSVLAVYARSADPAGMRARLLGITREFAATPPADWSTARRMAVHSWLARHQTAKDRAYWLAFWETAGRGPEADADHTRRLEAVTDDELKAALGRWLGAAPATVP